MAEFVSARSKDTAASLSDLQGRAVSGLATNISFSIAGGLITLLQVILIPRLLGPDLIGLFGLASAFGAMFEALSDFGFGDKLVQDRTEDFEASYETAFTLSFLLSSALCLVLLAASPLVARHYKMPVLWPLLSFLSYRAFTSLARLPLNIYYKRLDFASYRLFPILSKCCGFASTLILIRAGFGVWALAVGELTGLVLSSVPLWVRCKIRPKFRYDAAAIWRYVDFSWPLWCAKLTGSLIGPASVLAISLSLTMTTLGHYKLSEQLATLALSIDLILAQTAFPIFCRLQDSKDLQSAFLMMSRATMLWAVPFGLGTIVFAADFLKFFLTAEWAHAVWFLRIQGVAVLLGSLAYSWDVLLKAKQATRPILVMAVVLVITCLVVFFPCVAWLGARGILIGLMAVTIAGTIVKQYYLKAYFPGMSLVRIAPKEIAAGLAAAAAIVLLRRVWPPATMLHFIAHATLFVAMFVLLVAAMSRRELARLTSGWRGREVVVC